MNINKALQVQNPQLLAQKIAASNETGKATGQKQGKQVDAARVESSLIERLSQTSVESRENILEQVKARFESGLLLSREAAEATANSILE